MHWCLDIGQKGPEMTGISTNLRSCKTAANFSWYHLLLWDCIYKNFAPDYRHNEGSRHSKIRCPAVLNIRCSFPGVPYVSRSPGHRNALISKVTKAMIQTTNTSTMFPQKTEKKKKKERKSTKSLYANKINQSKSATPTTWNIRPSVSLTSSAHFKISTTTLAVWLENSTSAHMWNTNAENPHVTIEQKYDPSMGDKEAPQHGKNALKQAFLIKRSTLLILSAGLAHQTQQGFALTLH